MTYFYYLAAASILLAVLAALLLIPLNVSLQLLKQGSDTSGNLRIRWLGLTFSRKMSLRGRKKEKEGKKEKTRPSLSRFPETGTHFTESLPHLPGIMRTFLKSLTIERFSADVAVGLGSPFDTAIVSGYLWSLASIVNMSPRANFSVRPNFLEEQLEGSLSTDLKIRLLWIFVAFIKAGSKKPVRQLFTGMRR